MQRILDLYIRSRAAEYGFSPEQFCDLLRAAACAAMARSAAHLSESELVQWVRTLHLDDLVLARACAQGHEAAWEQFIRLYRGKLYAAALAIARQETLAREVADSVYADLFGTRNDSDGHRKSKLECYSGRGSLEGWLRSVLAQAFIDRTRQELRLTTLIEIAEPHFEPQTSNDTAAFVSQCADEELAALGAEDKFLLSACYLDGRTLAEIGRMIGLHESSVSRRLEKITSRLRKRIIARLCAAGIPKSTAEEMLEVDVRDLAIDVRKRLAQEGQG